VKKIYTVFLLVFVVTVNPGQTKNANYDSTLAKSFSADDFGMEPYVFVILKSG
jgi:hypothetical protein